MKEKTKVFLACAPGDGREAARTGLPCVCLYYRIGESGALQRARGFCAGRGNLLGLCGAEGLGKAPPAQLVRDLTAECLRREFSGVVLDAGVPPELHRRLQDVCRGISAQGLQLYVPEALADAAGEQACVMAPAALSGGSFAQLLEALTARRGAERLCLDLVRTCSDFPMPAFDPEGKPLSPADFAALRREHPGQSFFSDSLCCKYFTYRAGDGQAHFVLFDDADTAARKLELARSAGVGSMFLLYSEWGGELSRIFSTEKKRLG